MLLYFTAVIFNGYLVFFLAIWYIQWSFGIVFPVLVYCTKKNLATLFRACRHPLSGPIRLALGPINKSRRPLASPRTGQQKWVRAPSPINPIHIETRTFCSLGGCDVHCATPTFHVILRKAMSTLCSKNVELKTLFVVYIFSSNTHKKLILIQK
jgi:hypothetical protein